MFQHFRSVPARPAPLPVCASQLPGRPAVPGRPRPPHLPHLAARVLHVAAHPRQRRLHLRLRPQHLLLAPHQSGDALLQLGPHLRHPAAQLLQACGRGGGAMGRESQTARRGRGAKRGPAFCRLGSELLPCAAAHMARRLKFRQDRSCTENALLNLPCCPPKTATPAGRDNSAVSTQVKREQPHAPSQPSTFAPLAQRRPTCRHLGQALL